MPQMEINYSTYDYSTGLYTKESVKTELIVIPPAHTELARVSSRIGEYILEFFKPRHIGYQFYSSDVLMFVGDRIQCAPDSVSRIMRMLKTSGQVNYKVVNRAKSLYEKI